MRIATFNINGVRARLPRLLEWLEETRPDIACLQEVKADNASVPDAAIRAAGYHALWHGQKGFNGVAILSREPATERRRGLPGDDADEQARYLEAEVGGLIVASIYLPNGNPNPGPKFAYKLAWQERLRRYATALMAAERPTVLAGDWNVIPTDADTFSVAAMAGDALTDPQARARFRALLADGWTDGVEVRHPSERPWTYWDYQANSWPRDAGFRIDHLLLSPAVADRLLNAGVDKATRGKDKASDHAPTWIELSEAAQGDRGPPAAAA